MKNEDFENFSFASLKDVPSEERRKFLREVLENGGLRTVIFDASEGKHINVNEMVEVAGMDKVLDILESMIDKMGDSVQSKTLKAGREDIEAALKAVTEGNATEEQKFLVHAVTESMKESPSGKFHELINDVFLKTIEVIQEQDIYEPTISDIIGTASIVSLVSMSNDENSRLSMFNNAKVVMDVVDPVAEKILETFLGTLTDSIDESILIGALLIAAAKVAGKSNLKMIDAKIVRDALGIESHGTLDFDEPENEDEPKNGSNKETKTAKPKKKSVNKKNDAKITQPNIVKPKKSNLIASGWTILHPSI